MRIHRFDAEVSVPITQHGSRFLLGPLTGEGARVQVQVVHVPPDGLVGRQVTPVRRLLAAVAGDGWVSGVEGVRRDLRLGYVPFIFMREGFRIEDEDPWHEGGETWKGIRVTFPPGVPAHSRKQSYWFGPDGLLRRNDYTAEVFGGWAKAAHYCWDYRDFGGFMIPTRRKAMPRGPGRRPVRRIALVSIAIDDVRAR